MESEMQFGWEDWSPSTIGWNDSKKPSAVFVKEEKCDGGIQGWLSHQLPAKIMQQVA